MLVKRNDKIVNLANVFTIRIKDREILFTSNYSLTGIQQHTSFYFDKHTNAEKAFARILAIDDNLELSHYK